MTTDNRFTPKPTSKLLLRVVPMPADINRNGNIFGGWVMSQMDIAGGILASQRARSPVVTVSVETINFIRPIEVGDIVCVYGEIIRVGRTSIAVQLEVYVTRDLLPSPSSSEDESFLVASSAFTFVAIDDNGRPHPVDH